MAKEEGRSLGFLITKSARVVTRLYQKETALLGISLPPAIVLTALAQNGPMTQSAIGALVYMDKATLSNAIRHLRERGLIATGEVEHDARYALHSLTESGQQLAAQVVEAEARIETRLAALAPAEDRAALRRVLAALLDSPGTGLD